MVTITRSDQYVVGKTCDNPKSGGYAFVYNTDEEKQDTLEIKSPQLASYDGSAFIILNESFYPSSRKSSITNFWSVPASKKLHAVWRTVDLISIEILMLWVGLSNSYITLCGPRFSCSVKM